MAVTSNFDSIITTDDQFPNFSFYGSITTQVGLALTFIAGL